MTIVYKNGSIDNERDVLTLSGQQLPLTQLLGKSSPAQNIGSFPSPSDGIAHLYLFIGGAVISAFTSGTLNLNLIWTDETSTPRTQASTVGGAAGYFSVTPLTFLAKANTVITFTTSGSLVGTFDVFGGIFLVL